MKIDEMDFTPNWYCNKDNSNYRNGVSVKVLSADECKYLNTSWRSFMGLEYHPQSNPIHKQYADRLGVYYERFGVQMPAELRKEFLLRAKKLITYKKRFGRNMPIALRKELLKEVIQDVSDED